MKTIKGNLIELAKQGKFNVIIHGCNCFHTMGGGVALQIKNTFPQAYEIDKKTKYGDPRKLGNYSQVCIQLENKELLYIINGYIQYDYGTDSRKVEYGAIRSVFSKVLNHFGDSKIGIPMIGAGLAGGDWEVIEDIINNELDNDLNNNEIILVEYKP